MDVKRTEVIPEEDDFGDLFGVSYFGDEAEEDVSEEGQTEGGAGQTVEDEETSESAEAPGQEAKEESEDSSDGDPTEDETDDPNDDSAPEESEAVDGTEEVEQEDSKPADDAAAILESIRAIDPSVETFNDLEDVGLFALLLDQGKTPEEALRESSPKLQARLAEAQKAASKKHLRSTAASGRDDAIDMDAIQTFRRMNPKMSEKEAIALYKRVK